MILVGRCINGSRFNTNAWGRAGQAVVQKQLAGQLTYTEELLAKVHSKFVARYRPFLEVCWRLMACMVFSIRHIASVWLFAWVCIYMYTPPPRA